MSLELLPGSTSKWHQTLHFISLRLPSVNWGNSHLLLELWGFEHVYKYLILCLAQKIVLSTCNYFFSYYNGGEITANSGEVTTDVNWDNVVWDPFGKAWFSLYTIQLFCALAAMRETAGALGMILTVGTFEDGQDWDGWVMLGCREGWGESRSGQHSW